ncbi:MAG: NAD-dependent epimerase/dehydratase family protein, partial [Candidatus Obscuribacterales bacterium]|nr:NAD-dependent epimerase/dehydratase family protein [Candidatus Obscuribacterales bacterium]
MIGRALVARLQRSGLKVRAHGRSQEVLQKLFPGDEIEKAVCDLTTMKPQDAERLCQNCTVIVHCAALVHQADAAEELYESCNIRPTAMLAHAAAKCAVEQFIFLSSSSVYGNCETQMVDENTILKDDTLYAASKIASENYLSNCPCPATVVIRPALVFGEGDRGNMLSLIRQVLSGKYFIIGQGAAMKSLIFAEDLAAAISLVISNPEDGFYIYNVANPAPVSIRRLSEAILISAQKEVKLKSLSPGLVDFASKLAKIFLGKNSPLSQDRLAKLSRHNSISSKVFQSKFNFKAQFDLESALKKEIAWAKSEN